MQPYNRPTTAGQKFINEVALALTSHQERMLALETTLITLLAWVVGSSKTSEAVSSLTSSAVEVFLGKREVNFRANPQVVAARYLTAAFCAPDLADDLREKMVEIHMLFITNYTPRTRAYFDNFCPCCEGEKWSDDAESLYQETANPFNPFED